MSGELVQINALSKQFSPGAPSVLKNITASIEKGKMVALAGSDGAGKTTLIRLIAGLLTPTSGSIEVGGYDTVAKASFVPYLIGYMPQRFGLYEDLSVEQNLNLYADLRNVIGEAKEKRFQELLQFTGLSEFRGRLAKNLSGGMKQKLGLACALIQKPALLLLDEPSVGVDPISRRHLWKMVESLVSEGISVLWSTAYLDEAERCHSVLLLSEGALVYSGDPQELTHRISGRVYAVKNIEGDRRKRLFELLKKSDVIDGVIQGRDIRIVVKPEAQCEEGWEPAAPRFEDAFIDILGGGPGGESKLAERAPQVEASIEIAIAAENLTKKFGSFTAVDGVDLQVKKGEIFGLLGPNGAGKTTIFKMLCGLLHPTSGTAYVNGLDLEKAPGPARAQIGYMAQKFSLYGNLSVKQNLEFFAGVYNLAGSVRSEAIAEMVEIFNLGEYLHVSADELPLGYKQRLGLACANMHHPSLLFLDEPTSGVDPVTRREFWNHINGLVGKGVTIMITTHFMDEAEYCDRIALIYRGHIIKMGTPNELKDLVQSDNATLEDAFIQLIEAYDKRK